MNIFTFLLGQFIAFAVWLLFIGFIVLGTLWIVYEIASMALFTVGLTWELIPLLLKAPYRMTRWFVLNLVHGYRDVRDAFKPAQKRSGS